MRSRAALQVELFASRHRAADGRLTGLRPWAYSAVDGLGLSSRLLATSRHSPAQPAQYPTARGRHRGKAMMRISLAVVAVGLLVGALPASSQAQPYDHLKCYKAKDQKLFKKTQANITALQTQFGIDEDCQIKPKAKLFCVPASKFVTSIEGGAVTPF